METDARTRPAWADESPDALSTVVAQLRILILAGIPAGVLLAGVSSRLRRDHAHLPIRDGSMICGDKYPRRFVTTDRWLMDR